MHAVQQVLGTMLGWGVSVVPTPEALMAVEGPKLTYGARTVPGAFHVHSSEWLSRTGIRPFDPTCARVDELPVLFPVEDGSLRFDVFAAAFFLLARYEEWVGVTQDRHGRPLTTALHAVKHEYHHRPIVDEWALRLSEAWRRMDPSLPAPVRRYRQVITVDLDNGFKYKGRPLWRTSGSWARDLVHGRMAEVAQRYRVLRGLVADPFVIDERVKHAFLLASDDVRFFVLAASRSRWDHAVDVDHPEYARVLRAMGEWARIGLHPSYFSSERNGLAAEERSRLERVMGKPVTSSRQHFLKLDVRSTFRQLEHIGIREEHSFGLHDRAGFRAGTCTPYAWYDLQEERTTPLMVHPFVVMDNTLCHKLKLAPADAVEHVRPFINAIKQVNGTFTGLWHESFLSAEPNNPWRGAILAIIEAARA